MSLLDNAKALRHDQTDAEQKLWYHLRAHRFMGLKFKRQKPIGRVLEQIRLALSPGPSPTSVRGERK